MTNEQQIPFSCWQWHSTCKLIISWIMCTEGIHCQVLIVPLIDTQLTSQSTLDGHLDRYLANTQLTLDQRLDQHWIHNHLTAGRKSVECWPTHMYWSTLNGMSAKISWLLTEVSIKCQPRRWLSIDWVSHDPINLGLKCFISHCFPLRKVCQSVGRETKIEIENWPWEPESSIQFYQFLFQWHIAV